jgi:FSR family fosmidomycin resistance protein-like MFS transporter
MGRRTSVPIRATDATRGFAATGNFAVTLVIGQEYLPSRPALASGITLGLAMGVGGLIAAGLGPLADSAGTETALWLLAAVPIPCLALAALLPGPAPGGRGLLRGARVHA